MNKLLLHLGLCKKAGRLTVGTPAVCELLRLGKPVPIVILSEQASQATRKKVTDKCAFYGARLVTTAETPESIGRAIGKPGAVASAAVTDAGLAELIYKDSTEAISGKQE